MKRETAQRTLSSVREDSAMGGGTVEELSQLRHHLERMGMGSSTRQELSKLREAIAKKNKLRSDKETATSIREKEARSRMAQVRMLYVDASCIDLCFLVDATSSMQRHIAAVATHCIAIAQEVQLSCGSDRSLRLAFVAYRDYEAAPNVEFLDFTSDFKGFKQYVGGIKAVGGVSRTDDRTERIMLAGKVS
jgi:hypothetical protein